MANTNAPFGFIPSTSINGGDCFRTETHRLASGYGTSIYAGDPVKLVNGKIERCGATDTPKGVFAGVKYTDENGDIQYRNYWPANTVTKGTADAEARVFADPDTLFEAQFSATPTLSSIGSNFTTTTTSGDANNGRSAVAVTTTTTNGNWRLVNFVEDSANEVGEYARGLFLMANNQTRG
jgi:hypothetical protein